MNAMGVEEISRCIAPAHVAESEQSVVANEDGRPTERWQFVGATGLSAIRELALALGLVEVDDPSIWEPAL